MARPDASDQAPGRVLDTDGGWYELATRTACYLLDLDARRLKRMPRQGPVDGVHDTTTVMVRQFGIDRDWVELIELERCVVGEPMRLRAIVKGEKQPWHTTEVLTIAKHAAP